MNIQKYIKVCLFYWCSTLSWHFHWAVHYDPLFPFHSQQFQTLLAYTWCWDFFVCLFFVTKCMAYIWYVTPPFCSYSVSKRIFPYSEWGIFPQESWKSPLVLIDCPRNISHWETLIIYLLAWKLKTMEWGGARIVGLTLRTFSLWQEADKKSWKQIVACQ